MFGTLFSVRSIFDVLLIATIIYQVYRLLAQTRAIQLIKGVLWVAVLYGIALILSLETLLWIMNSFAPSVLIAMAIIFQPEIRQIMNRLGKQRIIPFNFGATDESKRHSITEVVTACKKLVEMQRGALLVFTQSIKLQAITENGIAINSDITEELITTIFGHNTVLHDGAVIMESGKIIAARCVLPLAARNKATDRYGTRHRAGIEITEESDAIAVIVSEETGQVSVAYQGKLAEQLSFSELQHYLTQILTKEEQHASNSGGVVDSGAVGKSAIFQATSAVDGTADNNAGATDATIADKTAIQVRVVKSAVSVAERECATTTGLVQATKTATITKQNKQQKATPIATSDGRAISGNRISKRVASHTAKK